MVGHAADIASACDSVFRHAAAFADVACAPLERPMSRPVATPRNPHWAQIDEFSFVTGMRLLFWLCRIAGRWPVRLILYPVLLWYFFSKPAARLASRDYLQRMAESGAAGKLSVLRHF